MPKYYAPTKLSDNIHETPEGYLLCVGVPVARTGDMDYAAGEVPIDADGAGKAIISRDEKEVFSPKTMASFEGKSLTIRHPDTFVNPMNWKELTVGVMQNVRRGSDENKDNLLADILVTDAIAIGLIKRGMREVSCGYEAEYTQTEPGRGFQSNIIGNHLALVEEGRAGPRYAITDHKAKGATKMPKKLGEKLKEFFTKTQDELSKITDEDMKGEEKKEESKDEEMKSYDELVKVCNELNGKLDSFMKSKDEEKPAPKKEEESKDEEEPVAAASVEDRLKALEAAVQKILQAEAGDESEADKEEMGDEEEEAEGVVDTGDTASRAEILAPGIDTKAKDVKVEALKKAYGTADGKKIIEKLTGGKAPSYSAEQTEMLFISASELLKAQRQADLSKTKTQDFLSNIDMRDGVMTADKLNEFNEKFYGSKK